MSEGTLELIKNYMRDRKLCHKLNMLAKKTFGIEFEQWVEKGYYDGRYIPYSFYKDGIIISNVSVNLMEFSLFGQKKNYIQIGTVMTEEGYRKQGYAKQLIEYVLEDYKEKVDGIYLFGTDYAKDFYLKLGFQQGNQYRYFRKLEKKEAPCMFEKVDKDSLLHQKVYLQYIREMTENSALDMKNYGLMTYWTWDMEHIYYSKTLDCYVALEKKEDTLYLNAIISPRKVSTMEVIRQMGGGFSKVLLGFTPKEEELGEFEVELYKEKDTNFLYLGDEFRYIEEKKLFFPLYSHA